MLPSGSRAIVAVDCPQERVCSMMEYSDLLAILAQLFVAFAGFAGIIAAFSTIRLSPEATVFRLRALVAVALFALVISLLPFLLEAFNTSETASLLDTQIFAALQSVAGALTIIGLFAVSAGVVIEMAPAIYLSGLFLGIVMCSFYFVMVVLAVEIRTSR